MDSKGTTLMDMVKAMSSWAANKTIANPERVGMNAVTGGGVIKKAAPWVTKGSIESARSLGDFMNQIYPSKP